ncbi:peptide deformylase [Rhodovulum imhoffii]|uniref:Peptide deformylase n=1 Tax=Rhodovulum imhoffii TaxID=365340 RepID=A0A2T5BUE8_9RHOB|nr:peptide deformylase [Rhodovulum imhoffii]MBK5934542.1 peptide deformylase [Rhodovulum imhoffii]PTN03041.1 peptide deformylase [Rhodovulum imhoffii]
MSILPILIHPDPRLKQVADDVTDVDAGMQKLAEDMLETMYDAPGVGLAAPQIGESHRLIVLDCAKDEGAPPSPLTMFNPRVVWESEDRNVHEEGCLSIPNTWAEITRPAQVVVQWTDPSGDAKEDRFSGLWATCVQHEIDHLNGVLFIDYLSALKRQVITRRTKKLKRQLARV